MNIAMQRKMTLFARQMLDKQGLHDWRFKFNTNKKRLGVCKYFPQQRIEVSIHATNLGEEKVKQVIAHEVAHAVVGSRHGHDHTWRQKAISLGDTGERCSSVGMGVEHQFVGICPNCKIEKKAHRRRRVACGACCRKYNGGRFDERYLFEWDTKDGLDNDY